MLNFLRCVLFKYQILFAFFFFHGYEFAAFLQYESTRKTTSNLFLIADKVLLLADLRHLQQDLSKLLLRARSKKKECIKKEVRDAGSSKERNAGVASHFLP